MYKCKTIKAKIPSLTKAENWKKQKYHFTVWASKKNQQINFQHQPKAENEKKKIQIVCPKVKSAVIWRKEY